MLRLPNSLAAFFFIFINCTGFMSCGFIDLRQIQYSVEPQDFDSVLSGANSPLIVRFDTEMVKKDAEGVFQVSSDAGTVKGDFFWQGNDLYFVPVSGWTAGIKYNLFLNGTVRSLDGRDLRLQHYTSFYAINKNPPPLLAYNYPSDGEAVGTNNFYLELCFSVPMNRLSVESALSIDGIGNKTFEWLGNDTIIKVIADKPLAAWTSYRWNLKDSAKSVNGVPLPKQYTGFFTTNLDQFMPEVTRVYPVTFSSGKWSATGAEIETGLLLGEGIAIEFNKPMDESVLRSVRFEPSLNGRAEMLSENAFVYIFSRNPDPETKYTLIISRDARDTEGLKTGNEYRISFLPDIPYLKVNSFNNGSLTTENISSGAILPVIAGEAEGEVEFSIGFSLLLTNEEKKNITQKINLSPFFPRALSPVALQFVSWVSDDRVFMRWESLKAGSSEAIHYYKLIIPGGKGGISAGGLYMKEDFIIYLEAIND